MRRLGAGPAVYATCADVSARVVLAMAIQCEVAPTVLVMWPDAGNTSSSNVPVSGLRSTRAVIIPSAIVRGPALLLA